MPGLHFACVFQAANVSSSVRMEGAGASIVSHAAETRGMDSADEEPETSHVREADDDVMVPSEIREIYSADEEPETSHVSETDEQKLPSAVMDLIRRLEGAGEPFLGLPNLRWSEFFPVRELLSTIKGWRSEVRLRVLEAIGRCDTFIQLDIQTIFGGDISRLTASEWERVLRGFRSSTHLREIRVEDLTWISDEEVESLCLHLGIILNSSSVTELKIGNCSLSARCFLNLASGLRGNSKSQLQSLELRRAWEDSSAVKHVADMINSAPLLKTLSLSGYLNHRNDMDEETVRILSQALIQRSSLKELVLVEVEWGAALLLQALAGEDRNRSIERLHLHDMVRLGDCLRQVLSSNASLKEMSLHSLRMRPEEWHQLGEFISDNARAVHIYVHFGFDQNVEDNWKSIEALACPARFRARDLTVELDLKPPSDHDFLLSLKLLGRILRGEIKALESFNISFSTWPPFTDNRLETILSMDGKTGETSVLKKLGLHVKNTYKEDEDLFLCLKGAWKHLFWCLQGNKSLTHLDLCGSKLDDEGFRDLMGLLQVNFTLEKIDVTGTSWEKDGKAAQINEALKRKQAEYMSVFTEAGLTFGDARAGRLVLCGSPRAGKTRLRHTLMRIVEAKSWLGNKWDELRTNGMKGIEVEFLQKNDRREISIWDVAGQQYFCTIRRLLFPQSSNFCVFLFVYSPFFPEQSSLAEFSSFTDLPSYRYITRGIIIEEMISYLNDIGSIIFIPNTDCIIVNPNWLITTLAHPLTQHTMSHASHTSKDGFVSESVFAGLIEVFLRSQPHGQRGVNREMLENILINLDLCFKLEDSSQYFIPLLLPEHGGAHVESMAWKTKDETSKFVGIRIQCQDQRTMSLTADFFARFQMFMIRKLIYEMHVSEKNVGYSQNCLQLLLDGHEIYVEQGTRIEQGTRNTYVDVLMLCPTYRSRSEDLRYVMKHIVQELISFCASPKGCPGVALVLGVIQTFCVEMLIPSHLRGAILIENLRSKFICSIKDKLEDIPLDCLHLENEDGLFDYEHSWPFIEGHTTESIFERARDLLWESDVEAVLNEIRQHRIQQLESLQQGLINVNNDLVHSHLEYFFPSFIREYASMEEHPYVVLGGARGGPHMESMAWKTKDETSKFVGIRIQREDGRTMSLTSAFFPCFQMFIKRKLISEMHVSKKKTVTCSQYYLRILLDGHEIYVEQGTSHNYVDVLMLCSKHKSRLGALQYMMKHIVQEVLSFYASPKGCPGVALVLGVIQTHCVKELKPSVLRKAILIEELKSNFTRRINDNLRIFRWKNRT
ncbi:hypothetical protein AXG93_3841s1000 [Marchantia polymorpha subsp. ruderalis]|uniref:Uncharacterized protein n=1 Tax=Marchantia polymorpha subsp. ruderalis TaxID=1480154 RepID=A0A176W0M1_MARPO|nr:hypothetical protein AXG93_3841s1000 [Marchantia polymorpha subsp. ruderalis]